MEGDNAIEPPEPVVLSRHFGVEYLCADGHWYTGKASAPSDTLAIHECRTRWRDGALGVRVVEFRKSVTQQRLR